MKTYTLGTILLLIGGIMFLALFIGLIVLTGGDYSVPVVRLLVILAVSCLFCFGFAWFFWRMGKKLP